MSRLLLVSTLVVASVAGSVAQVAHTPPPLTALEQLVKDAYAREFGVSIQHPAIYDDPANGCTGDGHLTSTVYIRTSDTLANVFVLEMSRDGLTVVRKSQRSRVRVPAGTFRALSLVVRYPDTVGVEPLAFWEQAQKQINDDHAAFASSHRYATPLVVFDNTNVVIEPGEISPPNSVGAAKRTVLKHGLKPEDYDVINVINIDPAKGEGGTSSPSHVIYVGNYGHWKTALTLRDWHAVAGTTYQQLMAYQWGWERDWTPTCGRSMSLAPFAPFITAPILFGWEDVDGDGVPEILSKTPYGWHQ